MTDPPHITAHAHSIRHCDEIQRSDTCGCFYCCHIFPPHQINTWIEDGDRPSDQTALCPRCAIDAVIGSASGYPITPEFLNTMHTHWF